MAARDGARGARAPRERSACPPTVRRRSSAGKDSRRAGVLVHGSRVRQRAHGGVGARRPEQERSGVTIRESTGVRLARAVLGAAAVVLPAAARLGNGAAAIERRKRRGLYATHHWQPPSGDDRSRRQRSTFANPSATSPHGVRLGRSGPAERPPATAGVPVGTGRSSLGTNWSGTCTFTTAGHLHLLLHRPRRGDERHDHRRRASRRHDEHRHGDRRRTPGTDDPHAGSRGRAARRPGPGAATALSALRLSSARHGTTRARLAGRSHAAAAGGALVGRCCTRRAPAAPPAGGAAAARAYSRAGARPVDQAERAGAPRRSHRDGPAGADREVCSRRAAARRCR